MELGKLHVVLVHFPIALVVATATADVLWAFTRRKFFDNAGLYCLLGALLMAPLAAILGDMRFDMLFKDPGPALAENHATAGFVGLGLIIAAATARVFWRLKGWKWLKAVYVVLIAAAFVAIIIAGHLGGLVSHGEDYFSGVFGGVGGP